MPISAWRCWYRVIHTLAMIVAQGALLRLVGLSVSGRSLCRRAGSILMFVWAISLILVGALSLTFNIVVVD